MPEARAPALYFPVRAAPYRLEAGLQRFGADFGNGEIDRRFFQRDREAERYQRARRAVPPTRAGVLVDSGDQRAAHIAVLEWIAEALRDEHPGLSLPPLPSGDPKVDYAAVISRVQEDLTVILRTGDGSREDAIAVFVDMPSGWRPERILGASFREIHGPVPAFADEAAQAASMVSSMVDRGPYVRFVWTVCADNALDHHPEEGGRLPWRDGCRGWLRVERQVTVPFEVERAALFLIRTYLYPFDGLSRERRAVLRAALGSMPAEVAAYKGIEGEPRRIARALLLD